MEKIKYLSRIQLFSELEVEELEKIEPVAPITIMKKGTLITTPHQSQKFLYLIKSGKIRLYQITSEGSELTLDVLGVGHIFGEVGTFTTGSENLYAQTWEDSLICTIDKTEFENFLQKKPDIALKFIEILSKRLQEVEELLEYMAYGSVRKRLLFLLNKLSDKFGVKIYKGEGLHQEEDWIQLDIAVTHQELATMMGSIRETVTGLLQDFTAEGIIRKEGQRKPFQIHYSRLKQKIDEAIN
ncbi:Crp/Fnr family transcriptional regulator [Brevibacillus laterosporus]|uniref:Crp/Fnr family transcriptional regulator n=1 Tax=Brevibacillus laterosporus TaxID=1465 RepID=UPI0024062488|nr:Crp/Fnr family transcriptional regulator [Brevibacillus laterosporus]MDF9410380.1 Crp/Fnr family transcriptional regulator [Brevibacillus laterosporus]